MNKDTTLRLRATPIPEQGLALDVDGLFGALGYHGLFETWADVTRQFEVTALEPDEVLLARYLDEDYYGEAQVIFRAGDTYHWATGTHCSCMGLEGQWDPEAYTLDQLIGAVERMIPTAESSHREWGVDAGREMRELHAVLMMRRTAHELCPPPPPVSAPAPEPEPATPVEPPTLSPAVEATLRKLAGY